MKMRWIGCAAMGVLLALGIVSWLASSQVVIHEIAWAGTGAAASDEWIELHNPTGTGVNLAGWTLVIGDVTIPLGTVEGATIEVRQTIIEAGGYFLLERTDDATVSDVEADVLYKGGLSNGGEDVVLLDATGETIDAILFAEVGWPAGTASDGEPPYASMERVRSDSAEWRTNDGSTRNGLDAAGGPINGTPGRENAATIWAASAPRVAFVAPSDETASIGGLYEIEWTATDPDDAPDAVAISLSYSIDGGVTWVALVANLANTGGFLWDTAALLDAADVVLRIVVEDPDGHSSEAVSGVLRVDQESD